MNTVSSDQLTKMRHTAAHMLAAAATQLKPETTLGVGPPIAEGFYHDIDVNDHFSLDDLPKLQAKMEEIKKMDLPIEQRHVPKEEARQLFAHDPYKLELIDGIESDTVGVSDMGNGFFVTLCEGGHCEKTSDVGFFELTRVAGVYWRGDESRPQMQRIYGVLFPTKAELKEHLSLLQEARKRDHRKLGQELDLFTFSPLVGPGLPLFTPRGTIIRRELEHYLDELQAPLGFQKVTIPHLAKSDLYKTSGHWEKFADDLFHVTGKSNSEFVMKPMNCPHHTQIYASTSRSYRDLPLRFAESTMVYRDEQAGELQGLTRVRSITQDDAHVFCRPDQIAAEVDAMMKLVSKFYAAFNFTLEPHLSVRDHNQHERYLGDDAIWDSAEQQLATALKDHGFEFQRDEGEAAFYGPKIDFQAKDSLGRTWQLATIQLDFNQPARFDLTYIDETGASQHPVMIHRAILGSYERFMAILIEHYAGQLPLWLAPTQVALLPISDAQNEYAQEVATELQQHGLRTEIDTRSESIGKKIRDAQTMKVSIMGIIGGQEVTNHTITPRTQEEPKQDPISRAEFVSTLARTATAREHV